MCRATSTNELRGKACCLRRRHPTGGCTDGRQQKRWCKCMLSEHTVAVKPCGCATASKMFLRSRIIGCVGCGHPRPSPPRRAPRRQTRFQGVVSGLMKDVGSLMARTVLFVLTLKKKIRGNARSQQSKVAAMGATLPAVPAVRLVPSNLHEQHKIQTSAVPQPWEKTAQSCQPDVS